MLFANNVRLPRHTEQLFICEQVKQFVVLQETHTLLIYDVPDAQ